MVAQKSHLQDAQIAQQSCKDVTNTSLCPQFHLANLDSYIVAATVTVFSSLFVKAAPVVPLI